MTSQREVYERPEASERLSGAAYRRYALGAMVAVYAVNLMDQSLMALLSQPIKEDLHLSDTQLGALTGVAFSLLYGAVGVPIARWADRGNRVTITSLAIALWSVTVMACLFVATFAQLALARMAAAVAGSACKPTTCSLLGDYFPEPAERVRAMSIYWLGAPVSALLSPLVGGWLCGLYGWRMTFMLMGIPGIVLAVVTKLTLVEPRAGSGVRNVHVNAKRTTFAAVLALLWRQRSSRHLTIALIFLFALTFGLWQWAAPFLIRTHGMSTRELGAWLGPIYGLAAGSGVWLGGLVARRWFADDERGQMRLSAIALVVTVPCYVIFLLVPQRYVALGMLVPIMLTLNVFVAPTFSLMQRLVPDDVRATSMAAVMLLYNVIGMGLAPLLIGILSDTWTAFAHANALRYAMLSMSVAGLAGAFYFWKVAESVREDLRVGLKEHRSAGPAFQNAEDSAATRRP